MNSISIIIPTYNEEKNIRPLLERIDVTLRLNRIEYEVIFVDDHSTDNTYNILEYLKKDFPLKVFLKQGKRGKAHSLLEGFAYARYELTAILDADLQYPPEALVEMIQKIQHGADIVIANRKERQTSLLRQITSKGFVYIFAHLLHGLQQDVQSGMKVFKTEILERIMINPSPWTFDMEFLIKARDAGYSLDSVDIEFAERSYGTSKVNVLKASYEIGVNALKLKLARPYPIPFHPLVSKEKGAGFHYKSKTYVPYTDLNFNETAFKQVTPDQFLFLVGIFVVCAVGLLLNWHLTIISILAALITFYFFDILFNLYLIYRTLRHDPALKIDTAAMRRRDNYIWPKYTILCPLYKEWRVLPQFVEAISKLDYPKDKLQVLLLLEQDDKATIKAVQHYLLPTYFEVVVVPQSLPKTKPKACNYGLAKAKGEYIVIYDAEDAPEPLQLKKAVLAFEKSEPEIACIQAKLNFYNPHQNLLTRLFTSEYSLWFDLILTGLQSIKAPIPLGGTSNHFRTETLKELKGWDSFNVTEDCDLGIRLLKKGFYTAIIESTTFEEANSHVINWFWQRTRWLKGYLQTYLVHLRNPRQFAIDFKNPHALPFHFVVGGKIISLFVNPLLWSVMIIYFVFRPQLGSFIDSFFPAPILYMAVFSFVVGNFLYMYYYMLASAKKGFYDLIKYGMFVPFYWLAMSVAAVVALYKLIREPHYWAKTKHGLHLFKGLPRRISITIPKPNFEFPKPGFRRFKEI